MINLHALKDQSHIFLLLKSLKQAKMISSFSVQLFSISPRKCFIRILQSVRLTRSNADIILACLSDLSNKKCGTGPLKSIKILQIEFIFAKMGLMFILRQFHHGFSAKKRRISDMSLSLISHF